MSDSVVFDTLAYARRLKEAGVDDKQAEAHAEAARDSMMGSVATRSGLLKMENSLTWKLLGVAGLLFAALKLVP